MASTIPRVLSSSRPLLSRSVKAPQTAFTAPTSSRLLANHRPAFVTHLQRRHASGAPHYDPAPEPIEKILKGNHAEPHTPEEWKEIGKSALQVCRSQAERDAVQLYITNALKPTLTDEEIIAVASQVGVSVTTPEELAAAHVVFKNLMKAATMDEAETLFAYFDKTGEFPKDINTALNESLTKALSSPAVAGTDHGHHDDHSHGSAHHGGEHSKESFGIGWYLTLGAIPFSWILYTLTLSKSSEDNKPLLTRLIHKYDSWQDEWRQINELHTQTVEQAGFDRLLFRQVVTAEGKGEFKKPLRSAEALNQGAPINVDPSSHVNLDKVIEHYKKVNEESEQRRQELHSYLSGERKTDSEE